MNEFENQQAPIPSQPADGGGRPAAPSTSLSASQRADIHRRLKIAHRDKVRAQTDKQWSDADAEFTRLSRLLAGFQDISTS